MIIIYNNRGILIPIFLVIPCFGIFIIAASLRSYYAENISSEVVFQISIGIGLLISFIWTYLTSYDYIEVHGEKQRIEMNHHLFFISNRLWSYIMLVAGVLTIISGLLEFFVNTK